MLGCAHIAKFNFSSDLVLRAILRNFGDDFTQLFLHDQNFGAKSIGFITCTWEGVCRYAVSIRHLLRFRSEIRFNSGFLNEYNFKLSKNAFS
jgi:hypothetical protein